MSFAFVHRRGSRHALPAVDVLLLVALMLLVVAACVQQRRRIDDEALPTPVGIDRSGRSVGAIRRFASVIVNGVEYATAAATIIVDGHPGTQEDLRIGQIVTVDGLRDEAGTLGIAELVEYRSNVLGPITAVSPAGTLVVLGQPVQVTAETGIDDRIPAPALANLRVGDVLAVSGFATSAGGIVATRLERATDTGEYRVSATISAFDEDTATFMLNELVVDFSVAAVTGFLADDVPVRLIGELQGGRLRATSVVVEAASELADDGEDMDLEGLVSMVTSPTTFLVDEQPVVIATGTEFIGGTAASLRADVRVVVEGTVTGAVLLAERVEFVLASTLRVEGVVRSSSSGGTRLSVDGAIVLVDSLTQFEDNSAVKKSPFGPADLRVGDFVEVAGVSAGGGLVRARRIERDEPEATTVIRGSITANLGGRLAINGVLVSIDMRTGIVDGDGKRMSWNQLIRRARVGDRIKAKCFAIPGGLRAKEVEYSGPDG